MSSPLHRFFATPRLLKVVAFVLAYLVLYVGFSQLLGLAAGDHIDDDNVVSDATSIVLALAVPVLVGAAALIWFVRHMGWTREIFGRQPVRGSRWMWIAPILVIVPIVGHLARVPWSDWTAPELVALVLVGIGVGLAEEIATRGVVVKLLRDSGHRERYVAVGSSVAFALMHLSNLIAGMELKTVLSTVVYTFGFGMCMYLTMRVTGTIWAAVVLHGLTDPTTILTTGGVDASVHRTDQSTIALISVLGTFAIIGFGIVAAFCVRGPDSPRVDERAMESDDRYV